MSALHLLEMQSANMVYYCSLMPQQLSLKPLSSLPDNQEERFLPSGFQFVKNKQNKTKHASKIVFAQRILFTHYNVEIVP